MSGLRIWKDALGMQELLDLVNPNRSDLETYPDFLFDTQLVPAAGTPTLAFFGDTSPDPTITNMEAQGMLPAQNWFQVFAFLITPLAAGPSNLAVSAAPANQIGIFNDLAIMFQNDRAIIEVTIARKTYGPWRCLACHGLGGPVGFFTQGITAAAAAVGANQSVMNGPADGGFGFQGEIGIPPLTNFGVTLTFANGGSAISRDTRLGVDILGRRYRAVR
jgi:hypothetical protein